MVKIRPSRLHMQAVPLANSIFPSRDPTSKRYKTKFKKSVDVFFERVIQRSVNLI